MQDIEIWGKYRHYRWTLYKVIWVWKHSETLEDLVIYESLYDNPTSKIWCRPLSSFTEEIVVENKKLKRFEIVK